MKKIFAEKMFAVIFICGNLFLRIAGKIARIRTRKNFVPHGICASCNMIIDSSVWSEFFF